MIFDWTNMIGYVASALVIISFTIKNDIVKTRLINITGCICFIVYGIFSGKTGENIDIHKMLWPVIIPNAILCIIHLYHLSFHKKQI